MVDINQSKSRLDSINKGYSYRNRQGGRKKSFDEMHRRMTIYLQNDLFEEIQALRERGEIINLTEFVNKALGDYMKRNSD